MLPIAAWIACLFVLPAARFHHLPSRWGALQNSLVFQNEAVEEAASTPFCTHLQEMGLDAEEAILETLVQMQLLENPEANAFTLMVLAMDFVERPEAFSSILISDFGMAPLLAHQVRAVVMRQLRKGGKSSPPVPTTTTVTKNPGTVGSILPLPTSSVDHVPPKTEAKELVANLPPMGKEDKKSDETVKKKPAWKSVVVNKRAKQRQEKQSSGDHKDYGLPSNYESTFPTIASELEEFFAFTTQPNTASLEDPIREATAVVYVRHAKLFLGYYAKANNITQEDNDNANFSLYKVFPNKDKESADPVLDFILWLRSSRKISVSYEANLLRGLTKLLKFRFARESKNDPSYGDKAFDDIPLIREIRMLNRNANKRQRLAPRSSDEKQKWLSWPEYLQVVSMIQKELGSLMEEFNAEDGEVSPPYSKMHIKIATLFQKYLVLAIFASVPDRQRTIRELVVGKNFQKDDDRGGCWCIRHSPEDYKTGNSYGERPPLGLADSLTPEIDDFLDRWRQCLSPNSDTLFVQPRTGNPLTQDSVYQIVSRCCYNYMGKRTNPHLLRDMLVTHVRGSNASEKELESLALFMGHSINMQRTSYDRRTLTKKVEPALELMQQVNGVARSNQ